MCTCRGYRSEQLPQRFTSDDNELDAPPVPSEFPSRTLLHRPCSGDPLGIDTSHFGPHSAAHAGGREPLRRYAHPLHGGEQCYLAMSRRTQARDEGGRARGVVRCVEPDHNPRHLHGASPDDEHRRRGTADDGTRDAAHEQTTSRPMATPSDDAHVGSEAVGFCQNTFGWRLVNDHDLGIRPAPCQCAARGAGSEIGALIEHGQKD